MYVCCMEKSEENMFEQIAINYEKSSIMTVPYGIDTFPLSFTNSNNFSGKKHS